MFFYSWNVEQTEILHITGLISPGPFYISSDMFWKEIDTTQYTIGSGED